MIISALDSKAKAQEVEVDKEVNTEPKQIHEPIQIDEPNISVRCVMGLNTLKSLFHILSQLVILILTVNKAMVISTRPCCHSFTQNFLKSLKMYPKNYKILFFLYIIEPCHKNTCFRHTLTAKAHIFLLVCTVWCWLPR